jgi:transposase-like protein
MSGLEQRRLSRLTSDLRAASGEQIIEIERLVAEVASTRFAETALARRSEAVKAERKCPHCNTPGAYIHARDKNGRQRFRCRAQECRRTFNILTGTPMARARKPEKWGRYLGCMTDHLSVRRIIEIGIGVNHVTVWRWRHRFLKAAIQDNTPVLSGVIEADETFFVRSFKGERGWMRGRPPEHRAARPSGWGAVHPGLGMGQVAVLTALDSAGGIYEVALPGLRNVAAEMRGRIGEGSVLCSDGAHGYKRAAREAGAEHRTVKPMTRVSIAHKAEPRPTKHRQHGVLGLGRVNAHHGQLKVFINGRCRGVASKYLPAYLGWHRAMIWSKSGVSLLMISLSLCK